MKVFAAVALFLGAIIPTFTFAQTTAADYVSQGDAALKLGRVREALDDYDRAIENDPKFAAAYDARAALKAAYGALDRAVEDENRAIELAPNESHPYTVRGNSKRANGDRDGAIADYNRAIELNPKDHLPYLNRGVARVLKGQWSDALVDFRRSYELAPQIESYARLLSWVARAHMGEAQPARQELADYFDKQPKVLGKNWFAQVAAFLCDNITAGDFLDLADIKASPSADFSRKVRPAPTFAPGSEQTFGVIDGSEYNRQGARAFLQYDPDLAASLLTATGLPYYGRIPSPKRCQGWFYAGMKRLLANDKRTARDAFQDCIRTKQSTLPEYQLAQAELKMLGPIRAAKKKAK